MGDDFDNERRNVHIMNDIGIDVAHLAEEIANCPEAGLPSVGQFYEEQTTTQSALMASGIALCFCIFTLAALQLYFTKKYTANDRVRSRLSWVIVMLPVAAFSALCGIVVPRSSLVLYSVGVLIIQVAMYAAVSMSKAVLETRQSISQRLTESDRPLQLATPPLCCCCKCLPSFAPTPKNLGILECMVLQGFVVRACIVYFNILVLAENGHAANELMKLSEMVGAASLLIAIYGGHIYSHASAELMKPYGIAALFRISDISLALFTAQFPLIFEAILVNSGVFSCTVNLTIEQNARFVFNFAILVEFFLISLIATLTNHPSRNALFDNYPHNRERNQQLQLETGGKEMRSLIRQ